MFLDTFVFYFAPVFLTFVLIFLMQRTCVENGQLAFSLNSLHQPLGLVQSFIAGIPMMILPACQYYVGADCEGYVNIFYHPESFGKDPLYKYLNVILSEMGFDVQSIFIVCSVLMVFLYVYAICRESKSPILSLFLFCAANYYIHYTFCVLRQGIAMGIILVGVRYIKQRQLWKYLVCVLFAAGFHYSALVALPLYWLYGWHISNRFLLGLTCGIVILRPLVVLGLRYLAGLTMYGDIYFGTHYDQNLGFGFQIAVPLAIIISALLFCSDSEDREYEFYLTCEFIAFWLIIMTDTIPVIDRVYIYFHLWSILFIPLITQNIRNLQVKKFFISAVVLCYSVWFVKLWMFTITYVEGSPLGPLLNRYVFFWEM